MNEANSCKAPQMGLARLMKMAFDGADLAPLGEALIARAQRNPLDAEALMDLSIVLQLRHQPEIALQVQAQALMVRTLYGLPSEQETRIRLLAWMAPGDMMTNVPLEFLVEGSNIALDMLYLSPELPLPSKLPDHDLLFVAIGESTQTRPVLEALVDAVRTWPRPVINLPENILKTSREAAPIHLSAVPGLFMPASWRIGRERGDVDFPFIARPLDSHAGHGLERIDDSMQWAAYLESRTEMQFHVSPFIDYASPDGLYRKYRIVLIAGKPYACHMGISENWMIHYANAGMSESGQKREEEERFMKDFDSGFAVRHREALQGIHAALGLDYLVMDCGETKDGRLLVFEIDTGAVIHAMDPPDVFPYKAPQMEKVFSAFRNMLEDAVHAGA